MKISTSFDSARRRQAGYALALVMLLSGVAMLILTSAMTRTSTTVQLNDRSNELIESTAAAEAAVEKVVARMMVDYQIDAESRISNNLSLYRTAVPTASEAPAMGDFIFSDGQGNNGRTYIARSTTDANPPYIALKNQYEGLNGFAATYRIVSNARRASSANNITGTAQQEVYLAEIPVYQFAIFYNSLMEYTWAAPLTVRGRVHANGDIYVGSSCELIFKYLVTTTGKILKPAWGGHQPGDYSGDITYNGIPTPGYSIGEPALTLPIGTNNTAAAVREIILPPPAGEDPNSSMASQRYFNLANLVILVSNNAVNLKIKSARSDTSPASVTWTNAKAFLATNVSFFDQREGKTIRATQIDVGQFKTWITTNATALSKCNPAGGNPLNVVYVADYRTVSSSYLGGVRLINGTSLPAGGLTICTLNPLYVKGNYNCPNSAHLNTTNTSAAAPASLVSDALTILSGNWSDAKSTQSLSSRNKANSTTINAAILAGMVYSTGSSGTTFSGGVMNLTRLLEDWGNGGSVKLTLNTSIVNLFNCVKATAQFKNPGTYYYAPTRDFNFDQNFTKPGGLPPATPRIRRLVRAAYGNPPPNSVTYNVFAP